MISALTSDVHKKTGVLALLSLLQLYKKKNPFAYYEEQTIISKSRRSDVNLCRMLFRREFGHYTYCL
jgi:hypothetical protein